VANPSKTQTGKETCPLVFPIVRLSVVSVRGIHLMGRLSAMLHRNLRGGGVKIRD